METLTVHQLSDMYVGRRVQLSPHLDEWIMGDRYGVITRFASTGSGQVAFVKLDKSRRTLRLPAEDVLARLVD